MSDNEMLYKEAVDSFNEEEWALLLQLKRFIECIQGDARFREEFESGKFSEAFRSRLKGIGVAFEPEEMSCLCEEETAKAFMSQLADIWHEGDSRPLREEVERTPLLKLWARWSRSKRDRYRKCMAHLEPVSKHPRFNSWRMRRIAACRSELGHFGNIIDHPLFAFELSKGCSVGCWFCGFSAEKLKGVFDYTAENRALWRDMARVGVDLFGELAGLALCYYATEPSDNPNYLDFIKDYHEITGSRVCTATARPLKDPDWFRSLIAFYREETLPWPRISVLSTSMLKKIHETYTPEELRDVELFMQMRDAIQHKARSGRILGYETEKLGGLRRPAYKGIEYVQGSIACVSGFYVNMVDRTIKLISPCKATKRWPKGYRIFAQETFTDAETYRAGIEKIIREHMPENVTTDHRLAFRDDLRHEPRPDGFSLVSSNQRHHVKGESFLTPLGSLIDRGESTFGQISDSLLKKGVSPLSVSFTVKDLFDQGLLDETVS